MKQVVYEPANKYVQCSCDKRQTILLGVGLYSYLHILMLVVSALLSIVVFALMPMDPLVALPLAFTAIFILMPWFDYRGCLKDMAKAGHTPACSKEIALKAMWCQSLYSHYEIDVDPRKVDPQGAYGTPAIGLWVISCIVNWVFFLQFAYEEATSSIYPILFMLIIASSLYLLIRIKKMRKYVMVICILNIVTSGFLLLIYTLGVLVASFE